MRALLFRCLLLTILAAPMVHAQGEATLAGRIVDAAGQPVEGAKVQLYIPRSDPAPYQFIRTFSGPDGRFVLPDLQPRRYELHIVREGLAPRLIPDLEIPAKPNPLDLKDVRLEPAAAIEGRILNEDGEPIPGAEIGFYFSSEREAIEDHPPAFAGPDGSFRLPDLPGGERYDLWVRADGYVQQRAPDVETPTPEPLRVHLRRAHTLTLRVVDEEGKPVPGARLSRVEESSSLGPNGVSGSIGFDDLGRTDEQGLYSIAGLEAGTVDILVETDAFQKRLIQGASISEAAPTGTLEVVLTRGAVLEGRVLDTDGTPIPGVSVSSYRENAEAFTGLKWATTDASGHYRLEGLAPGSYEMKAERFSDTLQVKTRVGPGVQHLDLQFQPGTPVSGQVVDPQGAPLACVRLSLVPLDDGDPFNTVSEADGTFTFDAAPDGEFRLHGSAPGFAETTDPRVVSVSGQPVQGLVLRLARGVSITGRLTGADPRQLAQARVKAHLGEPGRRETLDGTVNRKGGYEIANVSPGTWEVSAELQDGRSVEARIEIGTGPVSADLEFEDGLTLSGRVLLDGRPLAAAEISVDGARSKTAYDGGFSVPGLRPGTHQLQILIGPGIGHSRSVEMERDEEIAVSLSTGGLEGRVLSPDGLPVAGAVVEVSAEQPDLHASFEGLNVRTGEDGLFSLPRVVDGSYRLRVRAPGFPVTEIHVLVPPGDTVHAEVTLDKEP